MTDHPEDSSKEQSVDEAISEATEDYGQHIDPNKLIEALEARGWVYQG